MLKRVLITDDVHAALMTGLEKAGFSCDYEPNITEKQVREIIGDYVGLVINSKIKADKSLLEAGKRLRFVGRVGSGMEIVDRTYASEKGIAILSTPEGNRNAVAEQALGMLLSLANNLNRANEEVKKMDWQREKNRGFELRGKTIGIIGFGHTGSSFAAKLVGLGMRILVYDKYLPPHFLEKMPFPLSNLRYPRFDTVYGMDDLSEKSFNSPYATRKYSSDLGRDYDGLNYEFSTIEQTDLQTIKEQADIISFHLPLTNETKHLADASFFKKCAKNPILINTSRGEVVKTVDLVTALQAGKIQGACLDVFENEKTGTYTEGDKALYTKLFAFENVVVSPHIAGWTVESKERLATMLLKKILNFEDRF